jgi:hypothetical protein
VIRGGIERPVGGGSDCLVVIYTREGRGPLGKRVPVENLRALLGGVFAEAERLLQPGGRLVLINPAGDSFRVPLLKLALRQKVDLGFGHFPLERWERR